MEHGELWTSTLIAEFGKPPTFFGSMWVSLARELVHLPRSLSAGTNRKRTLSGPRRNGTSI